MNALGVVPAAALQQRLRAAQADQAARGGAVADDFGAAVIRAATRFREQRDVETVRRERRPGALRPFDQHQSALRRLLPAEFGEFRRALHAVEIGVNDGKGLGLIDLHQGEGRARRLQPGIAGETADQRAGEGGLARAEIAAQRHEIAGPDHVRPVPAPGRGSRPRQAIRHARPARSFAALRQGALFQDPLVAR